MMRQKILCVMIRRGVCTAEGEKRDFRKCLDVPLKDPKLFWIESPDCAIRHKTWRELEEEYACAMLIRDCPLRAPERKFFNIETGDLYICRRGCMQPCIPPPCYDPEYPSILQNALYRLSRLCALAIFLGLIYMTHVIHIWGPSGPALDILLGDTDNKVDQLSEVGTKAASWWNTAVSMSFDVIRYVFPTVPHEDKFDQDDFILTVQEDLRDKKDKEAEAQFKEDENVFEEWELVYNYVPEPPKLKAESDDETDWLWMTHDDPNYVRPTKANMPYEKSALRLKKERDKEGLTLAAIYTDQCSTWFVTPGTEEEDDVTCFEDTPIGRICKSKRERKNTRVNPKDCITCPF